MPKAPAAPAECHAHRRTLARAAPAGEGVPLRVELADPTVRTLAFGAVPRGQFASRQLAVVNRGRAAVTLSLSPAKELFERLGVEAQPAAPVVLRPREEGRVSLLFR
jgi:hypothetical protein